MFGSRLTANFQSQRDLVWILKKGKEFIPWFARILVTLAWNILLPIIRINEKSVFVISSRENNDVLGKESTFRNLQLKLAESLCSIVHVHNYIFTRALTNFWGANPAVQSPLRPIFGKQSCFQEKPIRSELSLDPHTQMEHDRAHN